MPGRAAAEREHHRTAGQQVRDHLVLEFAERGLAVRGEDIPDLPPGALGDHVIAVEERHAQLVRDQTAHGRLAGPHEADQDDHRSFSRDDSSPATARRASTYPLKPKPAMIPSATGVITD